MSGFSISKAAASLQNEWLKEIGLLLNEPLAFAAIIIGLGLYSERDYDKRLQIAASLLLTFVLVILLKSALGIERPCISDSGALCPLSYSLPSMHAAIVFTLMFAFLFKQSFPAYVLFALFVSFTRLNIGVHTFEDIAAALPVAFMSVFAIRYYWERWKK